MFMAQCHNEISIGQESASVPLFIGGIFLYLFRLASAFYRAAASHCEEIETFLNKNNSKRTYQLVKDLTSEKQDRSGKYLTKEKDILS